ncbi:ComEA family DNA-binding protein [candidate division KSB1 bacterium]
MGKFVGSVLLVLCIPFNVFSQEKLIEILLENETDFSDETSAVEYLEYLSENPVNINTASLDELMQIPGLTFIQSNGIIFARNRGGDYYDLEAVRRAGNIPGEWFELIKEFMTVKRAPGIAGFNIRQRTVRAINEARGYDTGYFRGDPLKSYSRIRLTTNNNLSIGLLAEKDPGEEKLNDHLIGYVEWNSQIGYNKIIIGYYSLSFGQGLVFWRKSGFYKSLDAIYPVRKNESGGRGYVSSNESEGFKGVFYGLRQGNLTVNLFTSNTQRDAEVDSTGVVERIYDSGYHRTENELSHDNRLTEFMAGARFKYHPGDNIRLGFTAAALEYKNAVPASVFDSRLNTERSFKDLMIAGTDYRVVHDKFVLFGEAAVSNPGSYGLVSGIQWSENDTKIGIIYRDYSPEFYSPFGNAFSDNYSGSINERGLYFGIRQTIGEDITVDLYTDLVSIPLDNSSSYSNSKKDIFLKVNYRYDPEFSIYTFWKRRIRAEGIDLINEYGILHESYFDAHDDRFRFHINYIPSSDYDLYSRIEVRNTYFADGPDICGSPGYLFSNGIKYNSGKDLRLDLGFVLFETNGKRIYQVEGDLPGLLNSRQYSGRGQRFHFLARYNYGNFRFSLKYGITHYSDRENIGSGSNMIKGNIRQDMGIQVDYVKR